MLGELWCFGRPWHNLCSRDHWSFYELANDSRVFSLWKVVGLGTAAPDWSNRTVH